MLFQADLVLDVLLPQEIHVVVLTAHPVGPSRPSNSVTVEPSRCPAYTACCTAAEPLQGGTVDVPLPQPRARAGRGLPQHGLLCLS